MTGRRCVIAGSSVLRHSCYPFTPMKDLILTNRLSGLGATRETIELSHPPDFKKHGGRDAQGLSTISVLKRNQMEWIRGCKLIPTFGMYAAGVLFSAPHQVSRLAKRPGHTPGEVTASIVPAG